MTTQTVTFSPEYLKQHGWGWMLDRPDEDREKCFADLENDLRDEKEQLEIAISYEDDGPRYYERCARLREIDSLLGATS